MLQVLDIAQAAARDKPETNKARRHDKLDRIFTGLEQWKDGSWDYVLGLATLFTKFTHTPDLRKLQNSKSVSIRLFNNCLIDQPYYSQYPHALNQLASNLVCLPVSNSNVERIFSQLKLLYSKKRLRMNSPLVSQLMFLGINKCLPARDITYFRQ